MQMNSQGDRGYVTVMVSSFLQQKEIDKDNKIDSDTASAISLTNYLSKPEVKLMHTAI